MSYKKGTFLVSSQLNPITHHPYLGVSAETPSLSKSTSDYRNNMTRSGFESSESVKDICGLGWEGVHPVFLIM